MEKWQEQLVRQMNRRFGGSLKMVTDESGTLRISPEQLLSDGWQPEQLAVLQEVFNSVQELFEKQTEAQDDAAGWLRKALESGLQDWHMSQSWVKRSGMDMPLALFRLFCKDMPSSQTVRPLLRTYFGDARHLQLIELSRGEWVVFLGQSRTGKVTEQQDETLAHAQGLHELLLVELAADVRVMAERSRRWFRGGPEDVHWDGALLLQTIQQMRQIGKLAGEWMPGEAVHGLWMFRLEQMVMTMPPTLRAQWQHMLGGTAKWLQFFAEEPEMERTLLAWIQSDANMTATARELYIHRNTLMYRLDKVHQELGLDPRKLNDLILIRIGYGLNKMHKKS